MSMSRKKTFVFNLEWSKALEGYEEKVQLEVYHAVFKYVETGIEPKELKPLARMAFTFIKREIDYNEEKYNKTIESRRTAGRKGAERRWSTPEVASESSEVSKVNASKGGSSVGSKHSKGGVKKSENKEVLVSKTSTQVAEVAAVAVDNGVSTDDVMMETTSSVTPFHEQVIAPSVYPYLFVEPSFRMAFDKWLAYKEKRKQRYKDITSIQECYKNLLQISGNSAVEAMRCVDFSIANNYHGLFASPKYNPTTGTILRNNDINKYANDRHKWNQK